jgi:hypothetical protein
VIRLNRPPAPPVFAGAQITGLVGKMTSFTPEERGRAWRSLAYELPDVVRSHLEDLSRRKCSYCESRLVEATVVDRWRPKSHAMGRDGSVSRDCYWWLAYAWDNLFAICGFCNRAKGTRFPLADESARALRPGEEGRERPLLLDPCHDAPEIDLIFDDEGRVGSDSDRGRATIETLDLNRPVLVEHRRRRAEELQGLLAAVQQSEGIRERILAYCEDGAFFAGMARQIVVRWGRRGRAVSLKRPDIFRTVLDRVVKLLSPTAPVVEDAKGNIERFQAAQMSLEHFNVEASEGETAYFTKTRLIERVEIDDFKAIEHLELDLMRSEAGADRMPWTVFLGENGAGKSSILEAIALTLAGRHANDLGLDAGSLVCRIPRDGEVPQDGRVQVWLTGRSEPLRMEFKAGSSAFEHSDPNPKVLLLGYGATRLMPSKSSEPPPYRKEFVRVRNLFDPFVPLSDPHAWLAQPDLVAEADFDVLREALEELLPLGPQDRVVREDRKLRAIVGGAPVSLSELSAGFQSVVALALDLMGVLFSRWKSMRAAEGIVLLDEIGEHLHPAWKMQVVGKLRAAFPRVQFIASTHDPLCLKGLRKGEVTVMRRGADARISAVTDLPSVEGLRADQLLTSEFFGLKSAIDPALEADFDEYYRLLALRKRSTQDEAKLSDLRGRLEKLRVMGSTRRERLMLEAIDRHLAAEAAAPAAELPGLQEALRKELDDLLRGKGA